MSHPILVEDEPKAAAPCSQHSVGTRRSGLLSPEAVHSAPVKLKPAATITETGYWITSDKRHNSKCRYYQNSKGWPCGPEAGVA